MCTTLPHTHTHTHTHIRAHTRTYIAELKITVGYWPFIPTKFRDLAEKTQFPRTNLLDIINGEAGDSLEKCYPFY